MMGRPRLGQATHKLNIMLSVDQYEQLARMAHEQDTEMAPLIRRLIAAECARWEKERKG